MAVLASFSERQVLWVRRTHASPKAIGKEAAVTVDVVGASDNDVRHKCQASMPPPSAIDEASDNGFSGNFGFEKQSQLVR